MKTFILLGTMLLLVKFQVLTSYSVKLQQRKEVSSNIYGSS
jgi:hypothetical protein